MANVPAKYLDRRDSYYGQELPDYLQDDLTKDILASSRMPPEEALTLATEEHKEIQKQKQQMKENEGDYMYQIKKFDEGRRLLDQSERTANLYNKYKQRLTKRLPPSDVREMVENVSTRRKTNETGGRRTRKRVRKNKTKKRIRRHRKIN
jgi:phosphatidate phosphatase PAH1